MTETFVWSELRDELTHRWADSPHGPTEQRIIDVFMKHPQLVADAADQIGDRYAQGVVRSPWAVLATHVERAAETADKADRPVSGSRDRAKRIAYCEQWIRTAGCHFDSPAEIQDELFGGLGKLRDHADVPELVTAMLDLWAKERPRGERCEREQLERAEKWLAADTLGRERQRQREQLRAAA